MGHVTIVGEDAEVARRRAAASSLRWGGLRRMDEPQVAARQAIVGVPVGASGS